MTRPCLNTSWAASLHPMSSASGPGRILHSLWPHAWCCPLHSPGNCFAKGTIFLPNDWIWSTGMRSKTNVLRCLIKWKLHPPGSCVKPIHTIYRSLQPRRSLNSWKLRTNGAPRSTSELIWGLWGSSLVTPALSLDPVQHGIGVLPLFMSWIIIYMSKT